MELTHIATREGRLSTFLKGEMGLSTALMNKLKWQDKLFVNGIPRRADFQIRQGDVITLPLDEPTPQYPAEAGALSVLYEDEHILAVDKPAGMLIHPSRSTMTGTLANRVIAYYQRTGQAAAFHPVTRLDRDTFGVVLLAKNAHIHAKLNQLHSRGALEKTYYALVYGCPAQPEGEINAPIARRPLPSLLRYVNQDGKPSLTRYRVLEDRGDHSLLALTPVTGRTHQLRVHCAYMGHPILGDPQYGTEQSQAYSRGLQLTHQRLCAKLLKFTHPVTGEAICLCSELEA